MKILIVVPEYPQISQTYIKTEVEWIAAQHEIEILALDPGDYPYRHRYPHLVMNQSNQRNILAYLKNFTPDIIHGHYLTNAGLLAQLSDFLSAPFTLRSHSFDVLGLSTENLVQQAACINRDACLGLLAFPFLRKRLESAGVLPHKIVECYPVVDVNKFQDNSPNGDAIMNVGASIPKKNMQDFFRLSLLRPEKTFNLYAMGYRLDKLIQANAEMGGRVNFIPPVEPDDMPQHYKRHQWLVYTASSTINKVGWPLAIAEAQASGVGVCMQNIRPDLQDYVGDAGILFNTPEEAAAIIAESVPQTMRLQGFEVAKRCDMSHHAELLAGLWRYSLNSVAPSRTTSLTLLPNGSDLSVFSQTELDAIE